MEIQISIEELRKKKLFVATPMYGGQCTGMYMKACLDLQGLCMKYGIECRFSFLFNESLIQRARNYLADEFLRTEGFTHLLFLDADILFDPNDVITLLALDKDVIGGPYAKKTINWRNIFNAVKNGKIADEKDAHQLEQLAGEFVFNPVAGTQQFSVTEPLEVMEIGTGYMMIKREVFDAFKQHYPEYSYRPDHIGQAHFDGSRNIHAYFHVEITQDEQRRLLSEDYFFCQWWRKMGGKVWLCPWMRTVHTGTYGFKGDLPSIANMTGKI